MAAGNRRKAFRGGRVMWGVRIKFEGFVGCGKGDALGVMVDPMAENIDKLTNDYDSMDVRSLMSFPFSSLLPRRRLRATTPASPAFRATTPASPASRRLPGLPPPPPPPPTSPTSRRLHGLRRLRGLPPPPRPPTASPTSRRSECINHTFVYDAPLPVSRLALRLADKAQRWSIDLGS
ncbi:hypothetical protein GUJ93_ZPchr0002g25116 [Zizania palustris]|uniref:Uncharacterized protein n=1 Tax=Zizania palustris TaxID=103762 RepID=A0A8J5S043_ZIZPA|nr:hypothetical protein GUJ93_ZPchr0002g25116 [Zizania palustris]